MPPATLDLIISLIEQTRTAVDGVSNRLASVLPDMQTKLATLDLRLTALETKAVEEKRHQADKKSAEKADSSESVDKLIDFAQGLVKVMLPLAVGAGAGYGLHEKAAIDSPTIEVHSATAE